MLIIWLKYNFITGPLLILLYDSKVSCQSFENLDSKLNSCYWIHVRLRLKTLKREGERKKQLKKKKKLSREKATNIGFPDFPTYFVFPPLILYQANGPRTQLSFNGTSTQLLPRSKPYLMASVGCSIITIQDTFIRPVGEEKQCDVKFLV